VQGDVGEFGGDAENDMEVADWQQVGLTCRQPFSCLCALAFGAMPVAATVVGDALMAAILAAFDMAAQGCCPTHLNG
jgi:hypothetical protein